MAIIQVAYDIPKDISLGLMLGVYKRFNGVVRNAKTGEIVKHLKEVDVPAKKAGGTVINVVKNHPVAAIGVAAIATIGTATVANAVKKKKEKREKENAPKCLTKFDKNLKLYLNAIRKGKLEEKNIDNLMNAIEEITNDENSEEILVQLSGKDLKKLITVVRDYTKKLAKTNVVKLDDFRKFPSSSIDGLVNCLESQKEIFHKVG